MTGGRKVPALSLVASGGYAFQEKRTLMEPRKKPHLD